MMRRSYEEPMVNKTRNSPSRSVVVGPGHKEQSADNDLLGKIFVRRESGRRLNLALMERSGSAKFSDCSSDCSEGVQPRSAAAGLLGEHIGKELRGLYAEVVAQPVPERFLELLNKLEAGTIYLEDGAPNPEGSD
jgi:hypothetical protein